MWLRFVALVAWIVLSGCEGPAPRPDADMPRDVYFACVPDRATWDASISDIVQIDCTECHGATVANGASFSFTDYDRMFRMVSPDRRVVDFMAIYVRSGMMPLEPRTIDPADRAAIIDWASCGALTP